MFYAIIDGVEGSETDLWSLSRAYDYATLNGVDVELYNEDGKCVYIVSADGTARCRQEPRDGFA